MDGQGRIGEELGPGRVGRAGKIFLQNDAEPRRIAESGKLDMVDGVVPAEEVQLAGGGEILLFGVAAGGADELAAHPVVVAAEGEIDGAVHAQVLRQQSETHVVGLAAPFRAGAGVGPVARKSGIGHRIGLGQDVVPVVGAVLLDGFAEGDEVIGAADLFRPGAGLLQRGQEHPREYRDDGDDHQQLDKREVLFHFHFDSTFHLGSAA